VQAKFILIFTPMVVKNTNVNDFEYFLIQFYILMNWERNIYNTLIHRFDISIPLDQLSQ